MVKNKFKTAEIEYILRTADYTVGDIVELINNYIGSDCDNIIYNKFISEHVPKIMLGRLKGHSTAIRNFAKVNPDLDIVVVVPKLSYCNDLYKNIDNIIVISRPEHLFKLTKIDYIIFDCVGTFPIDCEYIKILSRGNKQAIIMGVGN